LSTSHAIATGRPHLSVVVPSFNEAARLPESLRAILGYLDATHIAGEVLVVDDGSSDGTSRAAAELLSRGRGRVLRNEENRGKGFSFRRGFAAAEGRWVLLSDADLSTPITEHAKLAEVARRGDLDVVIASRALRDSRIEVRQSLVRQSMGRTFNRILRVLTGMPFRDTQCGFKLMDRRRVLPIVDRMIVDGFAFDAELLYVATRFGLHVGEAPVVWRNSPESRVGLAQAPPRMLLDVLRVLWRFRRGGYNPPTSAADIPDTGTSG
jgi:glycosyltransferase involved in cell wall biosynthesis